MLSLSDIEGEVGSVLRMAGEDGGEAPNILDVALCITGHRVELVPFRAIPSNGQVAKIHGEPRIYARAKLSPKQLRWVVAHELGHLVLGVDSNTTENEDAANAFAAALLLPRRAFQLALRETGDDYSELAEWFAVTESCAALRFGEVTDSPLALVAPERTRVRGAEVAWPRGWKGPGIRGARLRDDRRRLALRHSF